MTGDVLEGSTGQSTMPLMRAGDSNEAKRSLNAMCLASAHIAKHAEHAKQWVVERWTYGTATCSFNFAD